MDRFIPSHGDGNRAFTNKMEALSPVEQDSMSPCHRISFQNLTIHYSTRSIYSFAPSKKRQIDRSSLDNFCMLRFFDCLLGLKSNTPWYIQSLLKFSIAVMKKIPVKIGGLSYSRYCIQQFPVLLFYFINIITIDCPIEY